jgi:hypothetical protein
MGQVARTENYMTLMCGVVTFILSVVAAYETFKCICNLSTCQSSYI